MRDAGRRAGFDNMVAANYHVRLAEMAFCEGDASTVWEHVSRVGTHVEGRAGDWALALQVKLLLEADRVDEAEALLGGVDPPCPAGTRRQAPPVVATPDARRAAP